MGARLARVALEVDDLGLPQGLEQLLAALPQADLDRIALVTVRDQPDQSAVAARSDVSRTLEQLEQHPVIDPKLALQRLGRALDELPEHRFVPVHVPALG